MNCFDLCAAIAFIIICVTAERVVDDNERAVISFDGHLRNQHFRDGKCGDDLYWTINGSGTLIISGTGKMSNFTSSASPWSDNLSSITSIEIKDGVESIGTYAFYFCTKATQVVIPSSVTSVGFAAFDNCYLLTRITIPSSVTSLDTDPFSNCHSLEYIDVEPGNTNYESIDGVLIDRLSHTLVRYPQGNSHQHSYKIPDGILSVGKYSFSCCNFLSEIIVSSSVETIDEAAFLLCTYLESITFPSSLRTVGERAFEHCRNLVTITFPVSVISIDPSAFNYCPSLATINVEAGNPNYTSIDGILVDTSTNTLVRYPIAKQDSSCMIPSNVSSIGAHAFGSCQFTDIVIPDTINSIKNSAFEYSSIERIVISENVTTIERYAFHGCSNLTSVFYQGSVNISTSHVFDNCGKLKLVCVSPDYESTTFSDWNVNSTSNTCKEFQAMFNNCYKGSYKDGQVIAQKRDEAAEWEKQSNHCYEYQCNNKTGQLRAWKRANATEWEDEANDCFVSRQCNNESGRIGSSVCKSDGNVHYACINNECVDETLNAKQWTVEIEMDDNVRAVEANTAEVLENIAALAGIKKEEVSVGIEVDENGLLIKVILYMDTKETASMVSQAVESIEKGEGCEYGVLCRRRRVIMKGNELSQGTQRIMNHIILLIIMMILLAY